MTDRQSKPETRQPSKEELEEVIVINGTPDQIAAAVLTGGAARREPARRSPEALAATAGRSTPRRDQ